MDQEEFGNAIEEKQVEHSTALHAAIKGRGAYVVGPLARLNLNHEKLHPRRPNCSRAFAAPCGRNCRGITIFYRCRRAAWKRFMLWRWRTTSSRITHHRRARHSDQSPAGGGGHGTEAPRGICWHHYRISDEGIVLAARIVPPTSQNQSSIEQDLRALAPSLAALGDEEAGLRCEHLIRNYDPCISCSVHFLKFSRGQVQSAGR